MPLHAHLKSIVLVVCLLKTAVGID